MKCHGIGGRDTLTRGPCRCQFSGTTSSSSLEDVWCPSCVTMGANLASSESRQSEAATQLFAKPVEFSLTGFPRCPEVIQDASGLVFHQHQGCLSILFAFGSSLGSDEVAILFCPVLLPLLLPCGDANQASSRVDLYLEGVVQVLVQISAWPSPPVTLDVPSTGSTKSFSWTRTTFP